MQVEYATTTLEDDTYVAVATRSRTRMQGINARNFGDGIASQVFISYSRKHKEFVQKLVGALVAAKREVWLDDRNIEPTAEWLEDIFRNIEGSDNFLFVISPDSVVSTYARKEIDHAALNNKRIVPIFYQPVPDKDIPEAVAKFQRIDFTGSDGFDPKFVKLLAALDTDLDWKQDHTRLLTRAKEWEQDEKGTSFLLRGRDLREAERWVAKSAEKEPKPTTLHSQYILASHRSQETGSFEITITVELHQMDAKDVTTTVERLTSVLGSKLTEDQVTFHIEVKPSAEKLKLQGLLVFPERDGA